MSNNFFSQFSNSISTKLLKIVLSIYFLLTFVVTMSQMVAEYFDTKNTIINELKTIESTFKHSITESIWDMDDEQLDKVADGISKLPTVTKVDILSQDGKVIVSKSLINDESKNDFYHEFNIIHDNDGKNEQLGIVRLYSDDMNIFNRIKLGFVIIVINSIIKTLALCILFLWAFKKYLINPLNQFTENVKNIDINNISGKRIQIVNQNEKTELTILENSFNEMLAKVDNAKMDLDTLNKELEDKVKDRTKKLTSTLYELKLQKDELEKTIINLNQAQKQLVESEKMVALGQLIAGVAHEINTPLGAIKSSGSNISISINDVLVQLPQVFKVLSKDEEQVFFDMIEKSSQVKETLTTREERKIKKDIEDELIALNIENARYIASLLVKIKIYSSIKGYEIILLHKDADLLLNTAFKVSDLITNTHNINLAVDRASKIVFALKSYSRYSNSEQKTKANLKDSIETVLTIYNNQIKQNTDVIKEFDEISDIYCYIDELNQVWTNLIHNALQAMHYKGTLTITIKDDGMYQKVGIKDTGCGIPEDIRERIFEPFFTTKPAGEGSGLGLDIIKKIVNKHNGTIDVFSTVGEGSEFVVSIPKN